MLPVLPVKGFSQFEKLQNILRHWRGGSCKLGNTSLQGKILTYGLSSKSRF